jgi:hypothetical protein
MRFLFTQPPATIESQSDLFVKTDLLVMFEKWERIYLIGWNGTERID